MLTSLADIISEMIPPVSAESLKRFRDELKQYQFDSAAFTTRPVKDGIIYQGDVIGDLPFYIYTRKGEIKSKKAPGMMLSYTCDMANLQKNISFALCIPFFDFKERSFEEDVKNQRITHFMYLPSQHLLGTDLIIDFSVISSFHSQYVKNIMDGNHILTLKELGNFLFLTKLTIHFFRIEPLP
jgi:hypothetical protein